MRQMKAKGKKMKSEAKIQEGLKFIHQFANAIKQVRIDKNFSDTVAAITRCRKAYGKLILCGMGKAGHIAEKSASTFCSLGFPALFLHPGEASHGDIGIITDQDILIVLSTSGKTREVIETINLARKIGAYRIVGITSHPDSEIRGLSDIIIDMGITKEASLSNGFDLAPTTSTLIMLSILDALALVCADDQGFSFEEYALFHHSGYLGEMAKKKVKK